MHCVEVVDPGVGKFFSLPFAQCYGGLPNRRWTQNKPIVIGPVYNVRFNLESVDSSGGRYALGPYNEQSFQHDYVDGLIIGDSPTVKYFNYSMNTIYVPFASCTDKWVQTDAILNGKHVYYALTIDVKVSADGSYDVVTVTLTQDASTPLYTGTDVQIIEVRCLAQRDEISNQTNHSTALLTSLNGQSKHDMLPLITVAGVSTRVLQDIPMLHNSCGVFLDEVRSARSADKLGALAIYDSIDSLELMNLNWLEGVKDIADLKAVVEPLREILKARNYKDPVKALRLICSLHLWWRYVIKTGLMDLKEIARVSKFVLHHQAELRQLIFETDMVGRGRAKDTVPLSDGSEVRIEHHSKVYVGAFSHSIDSKTARLALLHVTPTLSDLWDLIPFSFVVDWLLPIGDFIKQLTNYGTIQMLPIKCYVASVKKTRRVSRRWTVNGNTYRCSLTIETYKRSVYRHLPSLLPVLKLRDPRKQAVTAVALLVNMITK